MRWIYGNHHLLFRWNRARIVPQKEDGLEGELASYRLKHDLVIGSGLEKEVKKARGKPDISGPCNPIFTLFRPFSFKGIHLNLVHDLGPSIMYVHRERAMIGEGVLWKRVQRAKETSRRGELDSFARMVSENFWPSVAACREGSFGLREEVKVVERLREGTLVRKEVK